MRRRIVRHGPSTLTISIPSDWVKKFGIKKGDELEVRTSGNELRISTQNNLSFGKKQLDIGELERLGKGYLTASYRQGFDEIEIRYENPEYIQTIREILSQDITGFEIIRQEDKKCVIKDLTGHKLNEFNSVLKSLWILILDLSKESLRAIEKKDAKLLKNIQMIDHSINKFSNYCLRLLVNLAQIDYKKSFLYYHLIKSLEKIADRYKDLCMFYQEWPDKIDLSNLKLFEEVNEFLDEFYELFYRFDKLKMENFLKKTKILRKKSLEIDNSMIYYISDICMDIRDLASVVIELNL